MPAFAGVVWLQEDIEWWSGEVENKLNENPHAIGTPTEELAQLYASAPQLEKLIAAAATLHRNSVGTTAGTKKKKKTPPETSSPPGEEAALKKAKTTDDEAEDPWFARLDAYMARRFPQVRSF